MFSRNSVYKLVNGLNPEVNNNNFISIALLSYVQGALQSCI